MESFLQNASSLFFNSSLLTTPKISHYQVRFSVPYNHKPRTRTTFILSMAHTPAVEQHRVIIPNKHGENLVGILHESGSREIVILCHGFRSSKQTNTLVNLAAALENARLSSFRFDFAGNGESDGSFQYGYYWREAEDLRAVIQHFHESNRGVSAIVGHSKGTKHEENYVVSGKEPESAHHYLSLMAIGAGGGVVLLYASKYHDIRTVVNLSGRYDLKVGIEERLGKDHLERIKKDGFIDVERSGNFEYRVTLDSLMDRLDTNMHEACLQIDKECRVLTVHGSSDKVVPVEDASKFAKIIPNHKLHIIEGADHSFTGHKDELASVVVNFIKETLHQDKARQQKIIITKKNDSKLVGILHESGTEEIVILCHGLRSTKEVTIMINLASALENAGVSSFRFDFSGNGESDGSFEFGHYWREVDDLHDVIQHFHRANRIVTAIIGHSKGGGVVLLYASKYHDIKTVINISGRYDLKAGIEERLGKDYLERIRKDGFIDVMRSGSFDYRVTLESLMDRLDTNMHEACLQIDKECR
ncbi:hypothetical protein V8G54_014864 [Vigna mungo]|uniref:Serine aminopeptidase S33 domain-containing protein n=1 Tax=Vigna mungo TaxID=3915 RepID=A0AAQ3NHG1_VIGMU